MKYMITYDKLLLIFRLYQTVAKMNNNTKQRHSYSDLVEKYTPTEISKIKKKHLICTKHCR